MVVEGEDTLENNFHFPSGLIFLIVMYVIVAVMGLILSIIVEKSIITNRKNKYIFFIASLIYSFLFPAILISALLHLDVSSTFYRLGNLSSILAFVLFQLLVYRILNTFEDE